MHSGLLWYDNSKNDLAAKIQPAAARYQEKFGVPPDTCFVNPLDAPGITQIHGIEIKTKVTIQPNYLWLGVSNA